MDNLESFKPPFSFLDIDQNIGLLDQLLVNHTIVDSQSLMNPQNFMGFSNEFQQLDHHQFYQNFHPIFQHEEKNVMVIPEPISTSRDDNGKRKATDASVSSSENSSPLYFENRRKNHSTGKGKKVKVIENGGVPKEVVHVRARRGQATDSHSLAERVRRGKINERLRCLQDIVPGCYKSMGMAVMLDEIINYVQSLQNQVEFLSMKLTEASIFHNFDSDLGSIEALQRSNAIEGENMQRLEERKDGFSQIGQVDFTFGTYPSLPYHTT